MQELEKLEPEAEGRVLILKMNVQENHQIPAELDISSLPALALYRNGSFQRFIGGLGRKDEFLKQHLRSSSLASSLWPRACL